MQAIERIRVAMYHESDDLEFACNPAAMTEVLAHIDALTAENDRLRKDAERYRWLRKQHWSDGYLSVVVNAKANVRLGARCPSHDALDATIDEAMKGTP